MRRRFALALFLCAVLAPLAAQAQPYPSRPITVIVPFSAGGATDSLARLLGERLRALLGQTIIVENVAGAAGTIGVARAVRSAPDGYTLSIGTSTSHMLSGGLYPLQFDLINDLDPIVFIGSEPLLVAARKDLPANSMQELIAWLRQHPGQASVGIAGVGAVGHLTGLAFARDTGARLQFVPYRGNGPAIQDLAAGHIDLMIEPLSNFQGLMRAGAIKALAVTSAAPVSGAPGVPTTAQAGAAEMQATLWYGLWVPKGTPGEPVARLNEAMRGILADPGMRERLSELGIQASEGAQQAPEALRELQKREAEKWWPVIKASGLRPQ